MHKVILAAFLLPCPFLHSQPVSQEKACAEFSPAVVRIDTGRHSHGTGFVVGASGWILTAAHVVIDPQTRKTDADIKVTLSNTRVEVGEQVLNVDEKLAAQDFALVKIKASGLPFLKLGSENDAALGSDLTIIGFPFAAGVEQKFCLAASLAAVVVKDINVRNGLRVKMIPVHVVYFQGAAINGISGSPLISRETGLVIGIVTQKLTAIGPALDEVHRKLSQPRAELIFSGIQIGDTLDDVIQMLREQLANGLGAATGIEDAGFAFRLTSGIGTEKPKPEHPK